ncbi:MAG: 1-hydroxycarotenoid 3,4-desaturase CrtD [Pseudomonadota bacterium]
MAQPSVVIIGAGIGGLAAALRLSHAGCGVTVLEAHATPGGKMRTVPSSSGPVDAGPTVLTMRPVFEELFADVGETLSDHLTLAPLTTLARHYWSDGTRMDLFANREQSALAVKDAFGTQAASDFSAFSDRAARLFAAFDGPMMRSAAPTQSALTMEVLRQPRLIGDMAPHRTLHQLLKRSFREPKLVQLFGRYATYVGGLPQAVPAILSLIWQAEASGVWAVQGGMHQVATTLATLAEKHGAVFRYGTAATRLVKQGGRISGIETTDQRLPADCVLFNGDPRALRSGLLGPAVEDAVGAEATAPRSLSADVMAFDAAYHGPDLSHHTVFFADEEMAEFEPLAQDERPTDATLYICAQDHPAPATTRQRFEIIRNAPAGLTDTQEDHQRCQTQIIDRLGQFGLTFDPLPKQTALTTPMQFDTLFPASQGSLYGRSPQGLMAAFKRPTARTAVKGLYLCGGGAHPGAGVPMATLSGQHAAAAILSDHALTSPSHQTAMHGGMSTA